MDSSDAILMLRDPKALVKFKQNQEYARKADSVDSNPFVALGYKLYRTYSMLVEPEEKEKSRSSRNPYTKRSASLHASTSIGEMSINSIKIQQMQQHILQQQQQVLQQQHQQQMYHQQQQQQQQQQGYYISQHYPSQQFNNQQTFAPLHLYNPQHNSQISYSSLQPTIGLPPMAGSNTITPLSQQFSPLLYLSSNHYSIYTSCPSIS